MASPALVSLAVVLLSVGGCWGKHGSSGDTEQAPRPADAPGRNADNDPSDQVKTKLLGAWVATDGEFQGVPMQREALQGIKWTFTADKVAYTELGRNVDATYVFRPGTNPASFDFKGSGVAIQGIYELKGDTLKVCYAATERPTSFKTGGTSQDTLLFVFKRAPR